MGSFLLSYFTAFGDEATSCLSAKLALQGGGLALEGLASYLKGSLWRDSLTNVLSFLLSRLDPVCALVSVSFLPCGPSPLVGWYFIVSVLVWYFQVCTLHVQDLSSSLLEFCIGLGNFSCSVFKLDWLSWIRSRPVSYLLFGPLLPFGIML